MKKTTLLAALASLLMIILALAAPAYAYAEGDATKGAVIYKTKCGICHMPNKNMVGPRSAGVIGRKAGSLPDYTYSSALKAAGFTWDEAHLDKWLAGPSALVPGTKMAYHLDAPQDRADVIAYLKTLVPTP